MKPYLEKEIYENECHLLWLKQRLTIFKNAPIIIPMTYTYPLSRRANA